MHTIKEVVGGHILNVPVPGKWYRVIVDRRMGRRSSIDRLSKVMLGSGDEYAGARREIRNALDEACDLAENIGAQGIHFATELWDGGSFPVYLIICKPEFMRVDLSLSGDPAEVLGVVHDVLDRSGAAPVEIVGQQFAALRTVSVECDYDGEVLRHFADLAGSNDVEQVVKDLGVESLQVDYWCHIPGTCEVMLQSFRTPLGLIHNHILTLFDAIVEVSWFEELGAAADQGANVV